MQNDLKEKQMIIESKTKTLRLAQRKIEKLEVKLVSDQIGRDTYKK